MSTTPDPGNYLLLLAAEAIAGTVPGCAAVLRPAPWWVTEAAPPPDALSRFGPPIIARWTEWLGSLTWEEQARAIEGLAALAPATAERLVAPLLGKLLTDTAGIDRQLATEYLTSIPAAVRTALVPDPENGRLLPGRSTVDERTLVGFLPVNPPPFPNGAELPGTPYILERLLGSGGFGAVYKATNRFEQHAPPRAIKFCINPGMLPSLQRERQLLDSLMAAGAEAQWSDRVVKLYGHNLDAPIPFLVYEYIRGGNLTARLAAVCRQTGHKLRPGQVLGLVRRVCEAVAFAHDRGLVHRDLKPSNILISGNKIKLADFGIGGVVAGFAARASQIGQGSLAQLSLSDRGSLFRGAGTPLYMSPEQRQGEPADPRHDIYSIGVIWYQLLVGDHTRELHAGWADELAEEFGVPQRQIDLIGQCVGYLKKRPASARELLGVLPSPTLPHAPLLREGGLVCCLEGHETRVTGLAFARDARRLVSGAADGAVRLWDVEAGRELGCTRGQPVLSVAASPDGRRALLGCDDGNAWLWDLARGTDRVCLAGHPRAVNAVAFSPDGRRAATGGEDGSIRLWHVASGREILHTDEHTSPVTALAFTPDGLLVLSCTQAGSLRLWDAETGWEAQELTGQAGSLLCLAVSPDGRKAACASKDQLQLWDLESGQMLGTFAGHTLPVTSVGFVPGGHWLVSGSLDRTVRVWDVATRRPLYVFEGHAQGVNAIALAADGRHAASTGNDRTIRVWALPQREQARA
jgi:hypothetical protein